MAVLRIRLQLSPGVNVERCECDQDVLKRGLGPSGNPPGWLTGLATLSCTQEVTDTADNQVNFQNKTPCAIILF